MHVLFLLLYQIALLVFVKTYKFLKHSLIIHPRYYDFIFTGLFLHLLFKILLYLCFNLILPSNFNIIILLLSIYLCAIIDVYYYIHYILDKSIKYCFKYLMRTPAEFFDWIGVPEEVYMAEDARLSRIHYGTTYCSHNYNKERTRYYFFRLFFLIPISIRYFIIREPYLFAVIHSLIFINYLQDLNLYLLFIYLFIIQITRFIFYMGDLVERFKFKMWSQGFALVYTRMPDVAWLPYLNSNLDIDPKLLVKFTKNNMSLIMYFCFKMQLNRITRKESGPNIYYIPLSWLEYVAYWLPYEKSKYFRDVTGAVDHWFCYLNDYIPEIFNDCQKFVKKNQAFWLSVLIFVLYFEYFITIGLLSLYTITINKTPIIYTPLPDNLISDFRTFREISDSTDFDKYFYNIPEPSDFSWLNHDYISYKINWTVYNIYWDVYEAFETFSTNIQSEYERITAKIKYQYTRYYRYTYACCFYYFLVYVVPCVGYIYDYALIVMPYAVVIAETLFETFYITPFLWIVWFVFEIINFFK